MATYDSGRFSGRARVSGITEQVAECLGCGWSSFNHKNAVANAARHCDASGHIVRCHQVVDTVYGPPGTPAEALQHAPVEAPAHTEDKGEGR